ncbi:MAG: dTDP-glucose 4,6-dehydratase [Gammaproteobacteria bacterium]|jgi:dTDP-glucose 4,6-dehydratase
MTILVAGGAGFIGANFILDWFDTTDEPVVNLDKLTCPDNLNNLHSDADRGCYTFIHGDILDSTGLDDILARHEPDMVINFAAESHVDRSFAGPGAFMQTNIIDTYRLLESVRAYCESASASRRAVFRLISVSTDEVFSPSAKNAASFMAESPYAPNSPYAASKAAADHIVRSYLHLIECIESGPGHDRRHAIEACKITVELGCQPTTTLADGLRRTAAWYLDNEPWIRTIESGRYLDWIERQYGAGIIRS